MTKQSHIVQVKITDFSSAGLGSGICFPSDKKSLKIEVPFSKPGDEVSVRLLKKKRGIYQSQPLEWIHLSEERILPKCKHFGSCGGCRWQHLAYKEQLQQKEAWIDACFKPYVNEDVIRYPIIPCVPPWQYRNKMELTFSSDKAGRRYLGLILYGTRGHVFQMQECYLMNSWIITTVQAVSDWWITSGLEAYHSGQDRGSLRSLTLREGLRTGDRMVILTVSGNPAYSLQQKHIKDFVAILRQRIAPELPDQKLSIFLRIQQIAKGKPTQFYEMLLDGPDHIREVIYLEALPGKQHALEFQISPTAFFQPNTRQAEQLYSRAIQLTEAPNHAIVYDLYCGTGTLGICMAKQAKKVIGIELSPESSLDARENIKHNQLSNITIHTGDVGKLLPELLKNQEDLPDVVMVDPPRAGLDSKALKYLLELKAPKLTYISCNPITQAANLDALIKGGYRLKVIQPVDQFPQTVHVENIIILTL